jgi:hypothetical protein
MKNANNNWTMWADGSHFAAEDEELVTNAVETVLNLSPYLCLKIFADRPTANGNAQRSIT